MADLAIFLSNPGHHVATLAPVSEYLARRGVTCRVHSFCELRGFPSPASSFAASGAVVLPAWPPVLRRPARGSAGGATLASDGKRRLARNLAWRLILAPRLERQLEATVRLAVLPNDSAFPYDRVAALLERRRIRYVLVQEGIRFPLPAEGTARYGLSGARALAVWGEASAEHFRALGVDPARIHVTGSPRFDPPGPPPRDRAPREGPVRVLLITNPIDVQGFCSSAEKIGLVARFVAGLRDGLSREQVTLTLRPHPGESPAAYSDALTEADRALVSFDAGGRLEDLLAAHDVAVVMASTVGLEALRQRVPLAVLPTPGHGYVHDYVAREAALGVSIDATLAVQLTRHAEPGSDYWAAVSSYLDYHLAHSGQATGQVGQLMIALLADE
jgi:hypothetical protein